MGRYLAHRFDLLTYDRGLQQPRNSRGLCSVLDPVESKFNNNLYTLRRLPKVVVVGELLHHNPHNPTGRDHFDQQIQLQGRNGAEEDEVGVTIAVGGALHRSYLIRLL